MKKLFSWVARNNSDLLATGALLLAVVILVVTNYKSGTYLSGWDNLHPEFNFWLNVKRSLFPAWQEYQGLGLLGGMSHAADLSRQLILWGISVVLPNSVLRYFWHFLMLFLGPLGVYFFLKHILGQEKLSKPAFIGSLFYLCNLATVQYFYVPYESFSSFYGFLPWLLIGVSQFLEKPTRKNGVLFFVISCLATSAFYVQTLFIVYMTLVGFLFLSTLFREKKNAVKKVFFSIFIIVVANSFWLLPSLYFTITSAQVNVDAWQNRLSTPDVQFMNQTYGTPINIAQLKGYWFDYMDYVDGKNIYLMQSWRDYSTKLPVVILSVGLFLSALLGTVTGFLKRKKNPYSVILGVSTLFLLFILTAGNGVFGIFFTLLKDHVPLFGQVFRTVFTKWSIAAAFLLAWGIAQFFVLITQKLSNKLQVAALIILSTLIIIPVFPMFKGELFYKGMQSNIPSEYFELMKFFADQPKQSRIAVLPLAVPWGWDVYDWNYRGSGFLWYGIEQPILHRSFDVWSPYNETFYNQLSTALYSDDQDTFIKTLSKYQVKYLLLDESIIAPGKDEGSLHNDRSKQFLQSVNAKQIWQKEKMSVYELPEVQDGFVGSYSKYSSLDANTLYTKKDVTLSEGSYINSKEITYPFADLTRSTSSGFITQDKNITFTRKFSTKNTGTLHIPTPQNLELYQGLAKFQLNGNTLKVEFIETANLELDGKKVSLPQPEGFVVKLPNESKSVVIDFLDTQYQLDQGNARFMAVTLPVGLSFSVDVFDLDQVKDDQVATKDVTTKTLESEIWHQFLDFQDPQIEPGEHTVTLTAINPLPLAIDDAETVNCDVFKRGEFLVSGNTFEASDYGSACSGLSLPILNAQHSAFLRFMGENKEGRSISFYVENLAEKYSITQELLPAGSFDSVYPLLSQPNLNSDKYSVIWQTRSFGQRSTNTLQNLYAYVLPIEDLSQIEVMNSENIAQVENPVTVEAVRKTGTFLYQVELSSKGEGVLSLHQGFDAGWIAVDTTELRYRLHHVQMNGWENGWIIPSAGRKTLFIIYMPQILAFLGYSLLCGTLASVLIWASYKTFIRK